MYECDGFIYSALPVGISTYNNGYACANTIMFEILHLYCYFFPIISTICYKHWKHSAQIKA